MSETERHHGDVWAGPVPVELELDVPEFEIPDCRPPTFPHDQVSREELELALERAKLVAEDCATVLRPVVQAMLDGAWVSRRADEFSLALEENARKVTRAAEQTVALIENALAQYTEDEQTGSDDEYEVHLPTPMIDSSEVRF